MGRHSGTQECWQQAMGARLEEASGLVAPAQRAERFVNCFLSDSVPIPGFAGPQVLLEVFGAELAPEVAARYLQEQAGGRYRFRQQYARWAGRVPLQGQLCLRCSPQVCTCWQLSTSSSTPVLVMHACQFEGVSLPASPRLPPSASRSLTAFSLASSRCQ